MPPARSLYGFVAAAICVLLLLTPGGGCLVRFEPCSSAGRDTI